MEKGLMSLNEMIRRNAMGERALEIERKELDYREQKLKDLQEKIEPLEFDNVSQKLLLLESLGVLAAISENTNTPISSKKMGRIIADLLNEKETTVTRILRYFNPHSQPEDKNNPRTKKNLTALHQNLVKLNLPNLEKKVGEELSNVSLDNN